MTSTAAMRQAWHPPCEGSFSTVTLYGGGRIRVSTGTVSAFLALNECLKRHGYEARSAVTGAFNCRKITGGTGYSLHAYGIAADINWDKNPYGPKLVTDMPGAMIADIKAIRTNNSNAVFRWGGDYEGNKDAMHYEVICTPQDLATGIRGVVDTGSKVELAVFLQQVVSCSTQTFQRPTKSACVGAIQRICATKFGQAILTDQDFGEKTEAAVKEVQRKCGLVDDGVVGPETWKMLMAPA